MNAVDPRTYVCLRASEELSIDGSLEKPAWHRASWTADFVDIRGVEHTQPRFRTRAKMLWDDGYLYIGAELEEPAVWATLTERDSVIFNDNDFEVFIDPDGNGQPYVELELNALNTTWDLLLVRPYRSGGPAINGWDIKGLKSAVKIQGRINDPAHASRGWSIEIAIPWDSMDEISRCPCPPADGDQWRINFSRVEWHSRVVGPRFEKVPDLPEDNWVWSPIGVIDMHRPERWGVVQFSARLEGDPLPKPYPGIKERQVLASVWDAEREFHLANGRWGLLAELGVHFPGVAIQVTDHLFEASYGKFHVDQTLRFWRSSE